MKNYYLNAKLLVNLKYNEKDPNFLLYVTAIMLLFEYYKDYKNIIIDIFTSTKIYIEDDDISNILVKHQLEDETNNIDDTKCGISTPGIAFIKNNNNFSVVEKQPYIVINSSCGKTESLIVLIHELNHIIKSYLNSYDIIDDNKLYVRSGLSYTLAYINEDCIEKEDYHEIFDEVINTLETKNITESITMLIDTLKEGDLKEYISSLDKELLETEYGYEEVVNLIKPLWNNDTFRTLIKDNIVLGNLDIIEDEFNKYFEDNEYNNLCNYIDEIYNLEFKSKNNEKLKSLRLKIKNIINKYNKETIKIYEK